MLYGEYRFLCRLEDDAYLPAYKGSTFRGVFGHALKKVVCALKRQDCHECLLKKRCVYTLVFETSLSLEMPEGSRVVSPPHPFVIEPPLTPQRCFSQGDAFDYSFLLFGDANNYLPYFIYAFERMGRAGIGKRINGKRGRFLLEAVKHGDQVIYSKSNGRLIMDEAFKRLCLNDSNDYPATDFRLKVVLETPLRLKFENRLKADLPFHILVRAMLRRVSSLLNCYGDGEPALDYRGLVKRAKDVRMVAADLNWFDWRRYSQRQDKGMLMGGMVGSVIYEGKLGAYMPLVDFCTKVHLGKQTSFGLGKIMVQRV